MIALTTSNTYCVWYPSGGFGHFINAVLTVYGNNFVRPSKSLEFSSNGNSHNLDLVVPKYLHEHWPGNIKFLENKNYCILIDNGINNEGEDFTFTFPGATVIKICYSDRSWPIVARTMIDKAMNSTLEEQLPVAEWNTNDAWAQREKYFLFLRDHKLRFSWRHTPRYPNSIYVDDLVENYSKCFNTLNSIVPLDDFEDVWTTWRTVNSTYIDPTVTASLIMSNVINNKSTDISNIKDIWTQAIVYYYIWLEFKFEVPHNTYSNWFTNTKDIVNMLNDHKVRINSNV